MPGLFLFNIFQLKSFIFRDILFLEGGELMPNKKQTSKSVASKASKLLSKKGTSKNVKTVAASALAQAKTARKKK